MRSVLLRLSIMLEVAIMLTAAVYGQVRSIELPGDNAMAELKPGPGVETARANCVACHSTDYIVRQPGSDAKHWETEVKKMMGVYGAPISQADVKIIVDYLATAYGPAQTKSPKEKKPTKPGARTP